MNDSITNTKQIKDYSISFVRLLAMLFIVSCHIMQRDDFATDIYGAHISWAWWFNVGIQMFLFISGYLYGNKEKLEAVPFYKKCFPKVLIDYYVFIAIVLIPIICFTSQNVDWDKISDLLTLSGFIHGLDHLWFIPMILFCYLLTPILRQVIYAIDKENRIKSWIGFILLLIVVHVVVQNLFSNFSAAWINNYILGLIYSRIEKRNKVEKRIFLGVFIALCLLIIPIQFRIEYWPHSDLPYAFEVNYGNFKEYGHLSLGITICLLVRGLVKNLVCKAGVRKLLDWSDKYSYDIYLVHHVFVQSDLGCVEYIPNRLIAIPLALVLTVISALLLYYFSSFIRKIGSNIFVKQANKQN